ncbi:MAG: ComEA family DNA-binding protein [Gemmatimonadales bacterium]|jgi:competence ComEA-like helix-hairpin-helix protein
MATTEDRRAAVLLLGLALAGVLVRVIVSGSSAPGAVGFRGTDASRPVLDSVSARAARLATPLGPDERIDVDRAPVEELTRLPRIGPALAARIVSDRKANGPFGSVDGLTRVSGVGPVLAETLSRHVTFSGRPRGGTGPDVTRSKIAVNRASAQELSTLPGIGGGRAAAILEYRRTHGPFRHVDDLAQVPGIGPKTVEGLRNRVRIP